MKKLFKALFSSNQDALPCLEEYSVELSRATSEQCKSTSRKSIKKIILWPKKFITKVYNTFLLIRYAELREPAAKNICPMRSINHFSTLFFDIKIFSKPNMMKVIRHVKPSAGGVRVTRFNALFHWAMPHGREIEAGGEVGRHHILTHCYWREAGPEFKNVNIMAVAHGTDKQLLLDHKAAIDRHLRSCGIPVSYTNVFWGGRSEIKPSEISPHIYRNWLARH